MIQIICDKCEEPFEVDPSNAGGKVPCPMCGDINRVPAASTPSQPVAVAETADSGSESEHELAVVRPGMFRAHPFRYLLIVLLFLGGIVGAIWFGRLQSGWSWVAWPCVIGAIASAIWFGVWWMAAHWWVKLIITNKRSIRHEGIIRRHTTEVLHNHVRSVDIEQTFLQRVLSVGSIGIDSAGQDGVEIEVIDIPRPYRVKEMIDEHRKM